MTTVHDFSAQLADGSEVSLGDYKGKVLLIVNTASKCGFTPQYEDLERVHAEYKDRGFSVLAFPCNQFGAQEPGSREEIVQFCETRFGTTFPLFDKIEVNGDNAHPLYEFMKDKARGLMGSKSIKWNFTKFLVDAEGNVVARYGSQTKPGAIEADIKALFSS